MSSYCVLDFETTVGESFKRKSNPFDPKNKIIVSAYKSTYSDVITYYSKAGLQDPLPLPLYSSDTEVLVGQNIKFDLLYIWSDQRLQQWLRNGGKIWDTMLAEYLLTGQQETYCSLNKLAEKYGGTVKDDRVKEFWDAGIDTPDIDPDILLPYAREDILNTEIAYLAQLKEARRLGMLPLIEGYMDHLLALVEMEFNGLHIDLERGEKLRNQYERKLNQLENRLFELTRESFIDLPEVYDPNKDDHTSGMLFNTPIKFQKLVQAVNDDGTPRVFGPKAKKAGEPVMRYETVIAAPVGFGVPTHLSQSYKKKGAFSSGEDILLNIKQKYVKNYELVQFIDTLLSYRETSKFLKTYIYGEKNGKETGLLPLVQPDGCIHHSLDTVQTKTGRLNASKPNMQNVPEELRSLVNSRFENGVIVNFDYNQLEVCVQAYLAQSDKMIQDIKDGVDFHVKRLAYAEELTYEEVRQKLAEDNTGLWKSKRRAAKTVSFQKAYGAHPEKIAKETHLPVETIERIFAEEDREYPEVAQFNKIVEESIRRTRVPTTNPLPIRDKDTRIYITRAHESQGVGYYQSITGKRYHFLEKASTSEKLRHTDRDPFRYFSGPEIANYPVQGTAADIVALSVGNVWRATRNMLGMLLINEVHDSLVIDLNKPDGLTVHVIQTILENVQGTFKKYLGIDWNVPIKVDLQIGKSWGGNEDE